MMVQQAFATGRACATGMAGAEEVLDEVLRRTEESFLAAGSDLAAAVDVLRLLGGLFDRLRVTFGAENGDRMVALIAGTRGHLAEIQGGFDRFLVASDAVRLAVRGVRVEVGDLDRVVRTIANVSINARIQGNGLIPPRPQVSAFIERLAVMAAEAETILGDVREAMAGIGAEMAEMDAVTQDLREELGHRVLPALVRFGRMAQGVLDRQDAMATTNAGLAARMDEIKAEVSRLVIGLQSGDATRQRLERVRAILADAGSAQAGSAQAGFSQVGVLLELVAALSQAAVEAAAEDIAGTVTAAGAVQKSAEFAIGQARACYVGRPGAMAADGGEAEGFATSIASVRGKLDLMRQRAAGLRERLGAILRHETALRQIGHQVRLSGLNAVLICAKLGEEGRALRELAQWLRTLTDESDAIVMRLQSVLDKTAGQADRLGGESIGGFEAALHAFFDEAAELGAILAAIGQDRADAAQMFDNVGQSLPQRLGHATQALMRFQLLLREMAFFDAAVMARRASLPETPPPDARPYAGPDAGPDAAAVDLLAELRKHYTMQSERDIHDRIVGAPVAVMAAPQAFVEAPVAAAADDLDDVLF